MRTPSWQIFVCLFLIGGGLTGTHCWAQPADDAPAEEEESPLLIEPESPEEAFEAATLMQRIGRPGLAKRYLQQILGANPDEVLLLKLRDKYGPAVFLRMANDRGLRPESTKLLNDVNAAFRKRGADPARIQRLIRDLSGNLRERSVAVESLRSAGAVVVPEILRQLTTANGQEKTALISALAQMGRQINPVLVGAVVSPKPDWQTAAIEALGYLGGKEEVPYLWQPAFSENSPPSTSQAARTTLTKILRPANRRTFQVSSYGAVPDLKRTALAHFRNEYKWPLKTNETAVTLWSWNDAGQTLSSVSLPPEAASLYRGGQLAQDAVTLAPADEEAQALFLAFALANASQQAGGGAIPTGPNSAYQLALSSGEELVSQSLNLAMKHQNVPATVAALQVLSQIATRSQIYGTQAESSPLVAALNYPHRRVQFAAAATMLQLDPPRAFPSSGRVVEILTRALGNSGSPAVLVIDPNVGRANNVAGLLQQTGFRGQPVVRQSGQTGFKAAIERNDLELIAIQANVTNWPLSQTLANFRADARTANTPILVFGPDWAESHVRKQIKNVPMTAFALDSQTLDFFKQQVDPFLNEVQAQPLSDQERADQASAAAYWLAHIANGRRTDVFNIGSAEQALSEAVETPDLAANAVQALGAIPTRSVQTRLQGLAVSNVYDTAIREQAALQLAFHIQRHGRLLTAEQILELRTASGMVTDPDLASALASVEGSLKPAPQVNGPRLQRFPLPDPLSP